MFFSCLKPFQRLPTLKIQTSLYEFLVVWPLLPFLPLQFPFCTALIYFLPANLPSFCSLNSFCSFFLWIFASAEPSRQPPRKYPGVFLERPSLITEAHEETPDTTSSHDLPRFLWTGSLYVKRSYLFVYLFISCPLILEPKLPRSMGSVLFPSQIPYPWACAWLVVLVLGTG